MGILANHVPSIEPLRAGVVEVIESANGSKKWFGENNYSLGNQYILTISQFRVDLRLCIPITNLPLMLWRQPLWRTFRLRYIYQPYDRTTVIDADCRPSVQICKKR